MQRRHVLPRCSEPFSLAPEGHGLPRKLLLRYQFLYVFQEYRMGVNLKQGNRGFFFYLRTRRRHFLLRLSGELKAELKRATVTFTSFMHGYVYTYVSFYM